MTSDRNNAERRRLAQIMRKATPPEAVGPEIPAAPGRGSATPFAPRKTVQTPAGPRVRFDGHAGRFALKLDDAFTVMQRQADRRNTDAPPLFTIAQIEAGRAYAALAEKCQGSGVKCSSIEAQARSSGGLAVTEAQLRDLARLEAMRRAIGSGWALEAKNKRKGDARRPIRVRHLVDAVTIREKTLSQLLRDSGWSANTGHREALRRVLRLALDRLYGM